LSSTSCNVGLPNTFSFVTRNLFVNFRIIYDMLQRRGNMKFTRMHEGNEGKTLHIKADGLSEIYQHFSLVLYVLTVISYCEDNSLHVGCRKQKLTIQFVALCSPLQFSI
jgi:hypothetical protein